MHVKTPRLTIEIDLVALMLIVALMVVAIVYRHTIQELVKPDEPDERPDS